MKRRGCIDCHLIEPVAGQWIGGRCPTCTELKAKREAREPALEPPPAPKPRDETVDRLVALIAEYSRVWPEFWRTLDKIRSERKALGMDWPAWCFIPVSVVQASASVAGGAWGSVPPATAATLQSLTLFGTWRVTQGVYRFHPEMTDSLWETPLGNVPPEAILALPEWCVYIEVDKLLTTGERLSGFFACLDAVGQARHLRLCLDIAGGALKMLPLDLSSGTVAAAIDDLWRDHEAYVTKYGGTADPFVDQARAACRYPAEDIGPLINMVLYLCSVNAEIRGRKPGLRPRKPQATKTKGGMRMFPPDQPTAWEVGWRIGAAIRAAREQERTRPQGGTHASPRPHIRRAHWHSFWTGPKAKPGFPPVERKLELKWLPPLPVNVKDELEPVPTIHPVAD